MKAALTILLAAALGSASPVGMQARDGQCDCSKPFFAEDDFDSACPSGYKNTSPNNFVVSCTQIGCSEGDFEAQCKADKSTSTPAPPTATPPAAPKREDNCQCNAMYLIPFQWEGDRCPPRYENKTPESDKLTCGQADCSQEAYDARCRDDRD